MKGVSFGRIGFWRLLGVGLFLDIIHRALGFWLPELSVGYNGPRAAWVKILLALQLFFAVAPLGAVVEIVQAALHEPDRTKKSLSLLIGRYVGFYAVYVFIFWRLLH